MSTDNVTSYPLQDGSLVNPVEPVDQTGTAATGWKGRAELIVSALLIGWGMAVVIGSSSIRVPATVNAVDPRFVPRVVGVLMIVLGMLHAIDVLRGNFGEADDGEDVDLTKRGNVVAVLVVAGSLIAHAKLLDRLGWPLAAALLFAGCATGLGAKNFLKTIAISVVLAFAVYFLFAKGLGVYLPRGVLDGVL
jgi:putative tricarboxylic transport membrane protein